ncbi:hypothetical protein GS426_13610 [Rhodococcus hoagii]|nr:hypothetical protein [Prescottella equi]
MVLLIAGLFVGRNMIRNYYYVGTSDDRSPCCRASRARSSATRCRRAH